MAIHINGKDTNGALGEEEAVSTLTGRLYSNEQHNHSIGRVYPSLANGVTIPATTGVGSWTLGAITEIVPVNTILAPFDIHHISVESASADTVYCLVLYYGNADTECGRVRFTRDSVGGLSVLSNVPFMSPLIPANSRIRAQIATPGDNGETASISLFYHVY